MEAAMHSIPKVIKIINHTAKYLFQYICVASINQLNIQM